MAKSVDIKLLKDIVEIAGAPGFEGRIRKYVANSVKDVADEITKDNMGNLICFKKGKSSDSKVMLAAHLDEISFIVTHVDDNGFIRFHTLGGFDPKTLTSQRVIVHGREDLVGVMGSKPAHLMKAKERGAPSLTTDYFVDVGLPAKEVKKLIRVGDPITRKGDLIKMGNCYNGKSLDNRIAVYILVEVLKELKDVELPFDLHAVFTVQEEVGVRGAQTSALNIEPDIAICLDTTIAFDTPGAKAEERVTQLGAGTAIKIMDSRTICDSRMVTFLRELAEKKKIKHQMEILPAGGTDTAAMQQMVKGGSIAGAISIPTRNIHQTVESVHEDDVVGTVNLMVEALKNIKSLETEWKD